jgi:GT2 family glycosyltransferase
MSKVLVGMVTFGGLEFTKLAINSIKETTKHPIDFFVVIGQPGDYATATYLVSEGISHIQHSENMGFPYSLNDIYDYAWKQNDYDYLVIVGNDICAYPDSIDSLIEVADTSNYEVISALQYDVRDLVREYPNTKEHFQGGNLIFNDFSKQPWKEFINPLSEVTISPMALYDIQNMCLYKKSIFASVGYTDVNFYPAYWVDNDYAMRIVKLGIQCCSVTSARFFHFWSRVIKQGSGGSNSTFFRRNKEYYVEKWGGDFGHETKTPPLGIFTRDNERNQINRWKK